MIATDVELNSSLHSLHTMEEALTDLRETVEYTHMDTLGAKEKEYRERIAGLRAEIEAYVREHPEVYTVVWDT